MKILLIGYGTRGDVQPLIALGHGLDQAGYNITIAAGSNFREMVTSAGLAYRAFRTDIHALMNSESGIAWIENSSGNSLKEAQNMKRVMNEFGQTIGDDLLHMAEQADVLVSSLPTFLLTHGIARKLKKKHITILLAPLNPTADHRATLVPFLPHRTVFLNRYAGLIGQYFTYWIFQETSNAYLRSIGVDPVSFRNYRRAYNVEVPVIYGISPSVMPPPGDWGNNTFVVGYWFKDQPTDWEPPNSLITFLQDGEAPIYFGFGSMANRDPQDTMQIIFEAIQTTGKRGVILSGWAGLNSEYLPQDVFLLDEAPHDWLFPRMSAVIHHGGAGTTAAALRSGVPNSVVAHMADQPYWGRRVHELGVGIPPIPRHKLNSRRLSVAIQGMTTNLQIRQKAHSLGKIIRKENGVDEAIRIFNKVLDQ